MNIALLVSWKIIHDKYDNYFIPFTHFSYLQYITKKYKYVYIISSVWKCEDENNLKNYSKMDFDNISIIPLPIYSSTLSAQIKVFHFIKAIRSVRNKVDIYYCRVPDPFSWMPALLTKKKVIMHFVGDTIDATKNNEKWTFLKKYAMITAYLPEYVLTLIAARRSRTYTNGYHLKDRIAKFGVKATAVVSSTISEKELNVPLPPLPQKQLTLCHIGYLRYAKGVSTLLRLIELMEKKSIDYHFQIIGGGEMYNDFELLISKMGLFDKVTLFGHVDNRVKMNEILRKSDLFLFTSLSEGSPRVVIEAMSQGIPVISTPVGSLPQSFLDGVDISFFDYNNEYQLLEIIERYITNPTPFIDIRSNAYNKVKFEYTKEKFLTQIFEI